ncbi:MAG: MMPL family transporter [Desulfomonile tiedjei]|nr:MMPL family transporter [Desulfomonile tiedjei]
MKVLVFILLGIARFSKAHPRLVIASWVVLSFAGFATLPFITISTDIMAGVGRGNPIIKRTLENGQIFGEQDGLILVVEFPEPPGENRLPFIQGLGDAIAQCPGVRRVRYRFLDPDDPDEVGRVFKNFLLGMNEGEGARIGQIFTPQGMSDALRRTRNRLFLAENPYIQRKLLEDPLELGQFVGDSLKKRMGSVGIGDQYLLIASPDSTVYLVAITTEFPGHDVSHSKELIGRLSELIPQKVSELAKTVPGMKGNAGDIRWYLTGKAVFQCESDEIFDRETGTIILYSFALVVALLLFIYRSGWSAAILMTPLAAGIGPNYGVIYFSYSEVNPVVMGATGVLLGLGAEYGEHLWGRIREEIDRGASREVALTRSYEQTGPPVMLGGLTGILAFVSLCFSSQPALVQFGYFGAIGLALTVLSTLFLVPALFRIVASRERDYFPGVQVSFGALSRAFEKRPGAIVGVSACILILGLFFATRVAYEQDLFKVFLARDMNSLAVSKRISQKFHSNFSQPTMLSFDVDDAQRGLEIQRILDGRLENLMNQDHEIASLDSISYLVAPDTVKRANVLTLTAISESWPALKRTFAEELGPLDFSSAASGILSESFDSIGKSLSEIGVSESDGRLDEAALERSWYMTILNGKYRFLTHVRYADNIADPEQLRQADQKILAAVQDLPVEVSISGTRQAMEAILSTLVSDLVRLGLYAFASVTILFFAIFPHPLGIALCLVPMVGAFGITLGAVGAFGMGLPFSIVCVAPLIFGFGIHNGIHVVMGSMHEEGGSVARTVRRVTPRAVVTSMTIMMGFVSMLTSRHYALEFLGGAMIIGMLAAVPLTLTTLPALVLLLERRRNGHPQESSP